MATPKLFRLSSIDEANRAATFVASTEAFVRSTEKSEDGDEREVYESIQEWDLDAYLANPVVLLHHTHEWPIGQAEKVEITDEGLEIRVKFASEQASELAERTWRLLREGVLRAGSVGFDTVDILSEELRDGVPYRTVKARLLEFSIVSVPADPGALAKGKDDVVRLDFGRLGKAQVTGSGGVRIPARISKVGIFEYQNADGSVTRELRTADDLFDPEAMRTLQGVAVTRNHPYQYGGLVDPEVWRDVAVGHVENPRREGDYLVADVVVMDADAIDAIDAGELVEISAGYICRYDRTPGVWQGQHYHVRHTRLRFNHSALLPKGHGRAGRDVGLRLDSNDAYCIGEVVMNEVVLDGKTYVKGSPEHIAALEALHARELATRDAELASLRVRLDAAEEELRKRQEDEEERKRRRAKRAEDDDEEDEERAEDDEERSDDEEERKRKRAQRRRERDKLLIRLVRLGLLDDEEDETKLDSLSERELMLQAIGQSDPQFSAEGKSDEYIRARFDLLDVVRTDSIDSIVRAAERAKSSTSSALPADEAALQRLHERQRNAWRGEAK